MDKCSVCASRYYCAGKHKFDCEISNYQYYMPDEHEVVDIQNVKCKITKNNKGGYHILVNGFDIAPYVTKFSLELNVRPAIPTIKVEIPVGIVECDELCDMIVGHRQK